MNQLSRKLEQLIKKSQEILPVKTDEGILVGDVLIQSQGPIKNIYQKDRLIYKEIHLNKVAIKLANLLAKRSCGLNCDKIYKADQEYSKWFVDSQLLRSQYQRSLQMQDYDKADMLWARYIESRDKTVEAKRAAETLCSI